MNDIYRMTAWFRSKIGIRETGENEVVFNLIYYGKNVCGPEFPWCCAFIWCGFRELGLDHLFVGGARTAYCPYVVAYARNAGRWLTDGFREGDILLYDWNADGQADHIGYCVSWDGHAATVIEGNCSDAVREIRRTRDQIMGAYRPQYDADPITQTVAAPQPVTIPPVSDLGPAAPVKPMHVLSRGSVGYDVAALQALLRWRGYDLGDYGPNQDGIDGEFGMATEMAVRCFQHDRGLEVDGEAGKHTFAALTAFE